MSSNHTIKCRLCQGQGYMYTKDHRNWFQCTECGLHEYMKIFAIRYWETKRLDEEQLKFKPQNMQIRRNFINSSRQGRQLQLIK